MESILERYERYSYTERQLVTADAAPRSWTLEYNKLKSRAELLQRNHRHYMGEDIESLSLKEIQNLEQQLDTGLKNIRARKNQLLHESISELQKKGKAIQEQNTTLTKKIKEKEKEKTITPNAHEWEHHNYVDTDPTFLMPPPPSLHMGGNYNPGGGGDGQAGDGRTNELDLSLQPIYSCHLSLRLLSQREMQAGWHPSHYTPSSLHNLRFHIYIHQLHQTCTPFSRIPSQDHAGVVGICALWPEFNWNPDVGSGVVPAPESVAGHIVKRQLLVMVKRAAEQQEINKNGKRNMKVVDVG
ncbi:hypothetical protein L2E82_08188 [Cichorium intybus]|uniref:Uncharacterized protein n=1 Tax=Cichorium intybus TaxID=13427 RepID=A0ACB9G6X2_CICIN|nr:hypothetical protein L2E82_08188 [Cichorium intybus]